MRLALFILLLPLIVTGCTLVPCNHVFPVPAFVFSKQAIDCRNQQRAEKQHEEAKP